MRITDRTEMKPHERDKLGPRPQIGPHNNEAIRMCVNAWHDLDGDRAVGMGPPGPIPFTAIVLWARVHRLDRECFLLVCEVIRKLDNDRAIRIDSARKTPPKGKKK